MNRKAIVERVAESRWGKWDTQSELCQKLDSAHHKFIEDILTAAGFWELLEVAGEIEEQFGYSIPTPYITRFRAAIAKAKRV